MNQSSRRKVALRSHHLYYVLCAFFLFTAGFSVYVNHALTQSYTEAVKVNTLWLSRLRDYSDLIGLASEANAPGNDVFEDKNVPKQSKQLAAAEAAFKSMLKKITADLEPDKFEPYYKTLLTEIKHIDESMDGMLKEAKGIMVFMSKSDEAAAGANMARMDRKYAETLRGVRELRLVVNDVQTQVFQTQLTEIEELKKYQWGIYIAVFVLVLGLGSYGQALANDTSRNAIEVGILVQSLTTTSTTIASASSELAASAAQTAAAITEATATTEEVTQSAEQCSSKAKAVSDEARVVVQMSRSGQEATDQFIQGMGKIRAQMDSINDCMIQLSNQSKVIGDIIASVDDLSQQSNLLAVNASIEAAKAGEQGKGFGVVAQEVKNLSQQSKEATAQVRVILNDVVKAITAAINASENGSRSVEAGYQQAADAGRAIKVLIESVERTADATQTIDISSQQQLVGMRQVVESMESIRVASEQNLATVGQLDLAGKELVKLGSSFVRVTDKGPAGSN